MQLGIFLNREGALAMAVEAERLGFGYALAPEGFRSDAVSVLGAVAAVTERIRLAPGVMQIPARTPVMAALTAATLNDLSGGRFALALGVSNPDVSQGWYGVPFDAPLARAREYVEVVRLALSGAPVRYEGEHFRLPPSGGGTPAHLHAAAVGTDLPVFLAGVRPGSLRLAGAVADGWIGVFCPPERLAESVATIAASRAEAGRDMAGFEVLPSIPIGVGEDVERAAEPLRPYFANFLGLGSKERSIYFALAVRMGFGAAAAEVHERCAAGDRAGAARAVPLEFMDQVSLIGDARRIAARMAEYAAAGVTTLGLTSLAFSVDGHLANIRVAAEAHRLLPQPV
ncbi:LLM class flavin-dependent oxidoreductase [Streptomyces sp. NPDC020742]|uniref:LLM class flavin-dependent oxidoreductase n=1 Tax=Streptomyces sp. NPDC020742 TaxID=3154897 RepID=UPI0033ED4161